MKKTLTFAAFLTVVTALPSSAACLYQGVYYAHGATICFDGWYQECTVADYWSAIGICHKSDVPQSIVQVRGPDQNTLTAMLLGTPPEPALSTQKED